MRYKNEATLVEEERRGKSIHEVCEESDLRKYTTYSCFFEKKRGRGRGGGENTYHTMSLFVPVWVIDIYPFFL
jgi:hypothetical protein